MQRYEYLVYSLIFVAIFLLILNFRKDLKSHIIVPCLIGAFIGPISELMYFKDYWRPYTLFGQAKPGIEDILFGSSVIGITLIVYPFLFKKQEWQAHHKRHARLGFIYILTASILLLFLNSSLHINSVIATGIVCVVLLVPLLAARSDLIMPTVITGTAMALIAGLIYFVLLGYIFRDALNGNVWLLSKTRLGIKVFKYVPLTELIWFFAVGGFLEAFDMYVRDAHFRKKRVSYRKLKSQRAKT
jgi:hypothetical protein